MGSIACSGIRYTTLAEHLEQGGVIQPVAQNGAAVPLLRASEFKFKLVPLSVDQLHRMKNERILDSSRHFELLEGLLFWTDRAAASNLPPVRQSVALTTAQFHRMIETGVLTEGAAIELIEGFMVWKDRSASGADFMTIGDAHRLVVMRLIALSEIIAKHGCHLYPQNPVTLNDNTEPEPDAAIVRGSADDYALGHPTAGDVHCVIEVADSTLSLDRNEKLFIYAAANIPQYVVINIPDSQIEVNEQPNPVSRRYEKQTIVRAGGSVALRVGAEQRIDVAAEKILPLPR